ncbi:MAG: beta-propeller fold lactonase family protein [Pseudomonadota bacterium]
MDESRRMFLQNVALGLTVSAVSGPLAWAQEPETVNPADRVFIANEDSNTISVIDPNTNTVETTINLTSFDEDPRPPFRFVTGGIAPTHAAMTNKPLYHGCIAAHGVVPSPDGRLLATAGRGSSNIYLIDTLTKKVIGNGPNPQAGPTTNPERVTSGILVGREPHEPTFTRDGRELWVALRGEDRIAILDVAAALEESAGRGAKALRGYVPTVNGPAQVWFSRDGGLAFVASQKTPRLDVFNVNGDGHGRSQPVRVTTIDISSVDKPGFTPFLKTSPDGGEVWLSHKLADRVSSLETRPPFRPVSSVALGELARPNHLEFVDNAKGKVIYVSLARVDDGGPAGVPSSRIAIIDRTAPPGERKVVGMFFSHGREAHGLWTNPANNLLYVAHEQDELPGTPNGGQTVCSAFDVSDPFAPRFLAQIPLGSLRLPSGELRNKKSINLVYVRPGHRGQTA